jgi:mono/diheme cytochrome c family protein
LACICVTALLAADASPAPALQPADPAAAPPPVETAPTMSPGEYLAAAGNCVTCHTRPGGEPFAGGLPFHTDFGTIYSTNITSHKERGIGGWTLEQFAGAIHEGKRADGTNLYPAFPYPAFTKITDADVKTLFDYIQSVPASDYAPPANEMAFPFSIRGLMGIWNALFFEPGRLAADSSQSAEWNRGRYLVESLGHCGTCHTPRNSLGGEDTSKAMTGGSYMDVVKGDDVRRWSSVNLTQAATGLAAWTVDDIALYMKTGHNNWAGTFGPMNEVITNSTSKLTDADIRAIAVYLKSLPPIDTTATQTLSDEEQATGEQIYTIHCGTCHLPDGKGGDKTVGPPVALSTVVQAPDAATLINVILYGAYPPPQKAPGAWQNMKDFYNVLSDEEVAQLVNFLRANFGNKGGAVTVADVAAQR